MNTRKKNIVASAIEPSIEDIWLNTDDNKLYFFSTEGWTEVNTYAGRTKPVCDTVYALRKTGPPFNPIYKRTGEFTVENCVTIPDDCVVHYTSVVDKVNLTDTVIAKPICTVIRRLTPEQFKELGGVPVDVPMGETVIKK